MVGKNNKIWIHFDRVTEYMVSCKYCGKSLSSKHTSSNLVRHLYRQHKSIARRFDWDEDEKDSKPFARIADPLDKIVKSRIEKIEADTTDDESHQKVENSGDTERLEPMYEFQMEEELLSSTMQPHYHVQPGSVESLQLVEKLKAETRYLNEMTLLARAKRKLIELQTKKLENSGN